MRQRLFPARVDHCGCHGEGRAPDGAELGSKGVAVGRMLAGRPATSARAVRALGAVLLALALVPGVAVGASPSFDCAKAASWSEKYLCGDDPLAALDRQMAALYSEARANATEGEKKAMTNEQRDWLRQREACKTATNPATCLHELYGSRIALLTRGASATEVGVSTASTASALQLAAVSPASPPPSAHDPRDTLEQIKAALPYAELSSAIYDCADTCKELEGRAGRWLPLLDSRDVFEQREKEMSEMQTTGTANSTPAVLVPDTPMGFRAVAYRNPQTNEIAIVYEGTSCLMCIKDWATNLTQPFWKPSQYASALDFAKEVEKRFCADAGDCHQRITQTGHSLGGGLAQYVAIELGRKAYTFNAAGLWGPTGGEVDTDVAARAEVIHFRSKGYMFGQRLGTDVVPYLGVQFSQQTIDIPVELPAWTWDAFTVQLATHSMKRLRDQMLAMVAAEPSDDQRIEIAAPDVAENGAVIPVTVGIAGEAIRDIALYSGDLSRLAIKAAFAPLASPWASVRVKLRETGDLIVIATTDDGRQLTARKRVNVTSGAHPKDGAAMDPSIKLHGKGDTVKMLMSSPMGATSHIASLRVTTGGQPLVDAETTPWLAENPYFSFKSAQDVGGRFEVEVALNSGERFAAQTEPGPVADPAVSVPQPPTSPPGAVDDPAAARVELKDGNILVGKIAAAKIPFASTFGSIEVDLGDVQSFADEALRLADGSVLKGRFGEGTMEISTSRGALKVPAKDVVAIVRGRPGPAPAAGGSASPAPGQGVLTGRVLDNFKKPVGNATVRILGSSLDARTDSDGRYRLNYVPGQLQVAIQAPGYDPLQFALALSAPTEYPVEDKILLRLAPGPGVFYWDKDGWTALNECKLKITRAIDRGNIMCIEGPKETYNVKGDPLRIGYEAKAVFFDNRARGSSAFSIFRVNNKEEIFTDIQPCGLSGFDAMIEQTPKKGTSHVRHAKQELFPGRTFLMADFGPGVYAIADLPSTCFKFQVGPDQPRAEPTLEKSPAETKTLSVDGKTVSYWPASSGSEKEAYFQMESKGYRNTYKLDCAGRRFLWTENIDLATGTPTGSTAGAEWKALSPSSTVSNAVYDAICPELLRANDQPAATTTGPSPVQAAPVVPALPKTEKRTSAEPKKPNSPKASTAAPTRKQETVNRPPKQPPRDARSPGSPGYTEKQQRAVREFNDM